MCILSCVPILKLVHVCDIIFNAGDLRLTRQGQYSSVNGAYVYIYRSMRVTVHSIDPLVATLTCITTGGPATNVTWTRDSEEIEGGVTVLESGYDVRYRHTLYNVTEGVYTCTVRNDKPSQVTAEVNLAGILILRCPMRQKTVTFILTFSY